MRNRYLCALFGRMPDPIALGEKAKKTNGGPRNGVRKISEELRLNPQKDPRAVGP